MAFQLLSAFTTGALLLIIATLLIIRLLQSALIPKAAEKYDHLDFKSSSPETTKFSQNLASALPDCVISPHDSSAFKQSVNSYWAQQECEVIPACVVQPRDVRQLCEAVTILKLEYDERQEQSGGVKAEGLFAIRSGGHSPVSGAASINGGVLIDLSLFKEVTISEDGSSVVIGAGAKWMDVSKVLDERGLAVVGGRNSAVGVGGLTLGGGLSFFSPQFGLVCSNIISYELVLADGSITTASASTNPDLWRALKGGSNNFGIVTRFTAHSFPSTKVWGGLIYMLPSQATKVLEAFHEFLNRADSADPYTSFDKHAAGPLASFSHIQQLGFTLVAANLVYTKLPENEKKWPACWKSSSFSSLWRIWSTCKVRTLTSATDELNALNPPGRRQAFGTTTIKNDLETLEAVYAAYNDAIASLRHVKIKGLVWTLVLQPLLPEWVRKGDANPLGLHDLAEEPLAIVSFAINWNEQQHDELVQAAARSAIEQMEAFAAAKDTGHRWRYLNYCAEWQRPFQSYGQENLRFLQEVSRRYDPEGLFQRGCAGGFKLDVREDEKGDILVAR